MFKCMIFEIRGHHNCKKAFENLWKRKEIEIKCIEGQQKHVYEIERADDGWKLRISVNWGFRTWTFQVIKP